VKQDRLRDGLVQAVLLARRDEELDAKLAGEILDRWDELVETLSDANARLGRQEGTIKKYRVRMENAEALLVEHHAVGVMDGALIGDDCPVCTKAKA
jgi:hypothetical protein